MAAATCRDIVRAALRKVGVLTRGAEPKDHQATDGLAALQSLFDEWVEEGKFGSLTDVLIDADYEAGEQERIVLNSASAIAVSFPATIDDAETGETRPPKDLALVVVVDPYSATADAAQTYIYDGRAGAWTRIDALAIGDDAPLARRGQDGLASLVAKKMVEDYGPALGAQSEAAAAMFLSRLSYRRTASTTVSEYF